MSKGERGKQIVENAPNETTSDRNCERIQSGVRAVGLPENVLHDRRLLVPGRCM